MAYQYRHKRFSAKLYRGRILFRRDGVPCALDCYFHTPFGTDHTSVYLEPAQVEELRKLYMDNGIWLDWDKDANGYWSNAFIKRKGYYQDARGSVPYRAYKYQTQDGTKVLYCMTDVLSACGLIKYLNTEEYQNGESQIA